MRLTKDEITLVVVVLLILVVGAAARNYRHQHPATKSAPPAAHATAPEE